MNLSGKTIIAIVLLPLLAGGCDSSNARFVYDDTTGRITPESQNRVTRNLDRPNRVCADLALNGEIVALSDLHQQRWVDARDWVFLSRQLQISDAMREWNAARGQVRSANARRLAAQEKLDEFIVDLTIDCEGGEFRNCLPRWNQIGLTSVDFNDAVSLAVTNTSDAPVYALRIEFVAQPQERSIPLFEASYEVSLSGGLDVGETFDFGAPPSFSYSTRGIEGLAETDLRAVVTAYADREASARGRWLWRPDEAHIHTVTRVERHREQRFYESLVGIAELLECNPYYNRISLGELEEADPREEAIFLESLARSGLRCSGQYSYMCERASDL